MTNEQEIREAVKITKNIDDKHLLFTEEVRGVEKLRQLGKSYLAQEGLPREDKGNPCVFESKFSRYIRAIKAKEKLEGLSEERIKLVIQNAMVGSAIPCKNPRALTVEELQNAHKMFVVSAAKAIRKEIRI